MTILEIRRVIHMPFKNDFEDMIRKFGKQKETYLIRKTAISAVAVLACAGFIGARESVVHADDVTGQSQDQSQDQSQQQAQTDASQAQTNTTADVTADATTNVPYTAQADTTSQTDNSMLSDQTDQATDPVQMTQDMPVYAVVSNNVSVPENKTVDPTDLSNTQNKDVDWSIVDEVKNVPQVKKLDTDLFPAPFKIDLKHRTKIDLVLPPKIDIVIDVNRREPIKSNLSADAVHDFAISKNKEIVQKPINEKTDITQTLSKEKEEFIKKVQAKVDLAPKFVNRYAFNINDWQGIYDRRNNEYTIYAYTGVVSDDLYIPRSRDFVNAGKIPNGTKVYMTDDLIKSLGLVK